MQINKEIYDIPNVYCDGRAAFLNMQNKQGVTVRLNVPLNDNEYIDGHSSGYILNTCGRFKYFVPQRRFIHPIHLIYQNDIFLPEALTEIGEMVEHPWSFYYHQTKTEIVFLFDRIEDALLVKMSL